MAVAGNRRPATAWEALRLEEPLCLEDVATPALLVDVDVLEENLRRMARHGEANGIGLRPHTKTHKCPILARRQLELGAVGVCAAKVSEAEVMVDAGIEAVLVTSPVVTREKIVRVVELARRSPRIQIVVDDPVAARRLGEAAAAAGVTVGVLVDLDPGIRRTGVPPGPAVHQLLEELHRLPALRFDGLQAYAGHVMHVEGWQERRRRNREALARCFEAKREVEKAGWEVGIFTGGGTGTFDIDSDLGEFTDLQVGSYLFMDVEYREVGDRDGALFDVFEPSLAVLTTAISQPAEGLITVDAGFKAFATDTVLPQARDVEGIVYHWGGDEHGILDIGAASRDVRLGDKLAFLAPHCDPTVNLYDYLHPHREGRVEELWPVAARGCSQ